MTTRDNMDCIALVERWAGIVVLRGHLSQAQIDVDLGQGVRGGEDTFGRLLRDTGPQLGEEFALQLPDALLRVQDQRLVFLEFRRDKTLAVGQRLAANVVIRHAVEVGIGNLDIVAKDPGIANFERIDARAPAFALLHLGNPLLTAAGRVLDLIQFGAIARADYSAIRGTQRWLVDDGWFNLRDNLRVVRQTLHEAGQVGHTLPVLG